MAIPARDAPLTDQAQIDVGQVAIDWMDVDLRPRLIVSDTLGVLWAGRRARALLDRHRGVFIEDGFLTCLKDQATRTLRALVRDAGASMATAVIPIGKGEHYLFRAWRISGGETEASLLEFCIDCESHRSAYAHLEDVFHLTASEHEVLILLLCGSTVSEIAAAKSIGLVTVRSHIRGIYNKVGVDSRERLFSRLAPFRIV